MLATPPGLFCPVRYQWTAVRVAPPTAASLHATETELPSVGFRGLDRLSTDFPFKAILRVGLSQTYMKKSPLGLEVSWLTQTSSLFQPLRPTLPIRSS